MQSYRNVVLPPLTANQTSNHVRVMQPRVESLFRCALSCTVVRWRSSESIPSTVNLRLLVFVKRRFSVCNKPITCRSRELHSRVITRPCARLSFRQTISGHRPTYRNFGNAMCFGRYEHLFICTCYRMLYYTLRINRVCQWRRSEIVLIWSTITPPTHQIWYVGHLS